MWIEIALDQPRCRHTSRRRWYSAGLLRTIASNTGCTSVGVKDDDFQDVGGSGLALERLSLAFEGFRLAFRRLLSQRALTGRSLRRRLSTVCCPDRERTFRGPPLRLVRPPYPPQETSNRQMRPHPTPIAPEKSMTDLRAVGRRRVRLELGARVPFVGEMTSRSARARPRLTLCRLRE